MTDPYQAELLAKVKRVWGIPVDQIPGVFELCRDLAYEYHSERVSIRDHADPNIRSGWVVGDITTCQDVLCTEAVRLLGIKPPEVSDGKGPAGQADRGAAQGPG